MRASRNVVGRSLKGIPRIRSFSFFAFVTHNLFKTPAMAECDVLGRANVFKRSDEGLVSGTSKGFTFGADVQHPKPSYRGEFVTGFMAFVASSEACSNPLTRKDSVDGLGDMSYNHQVH
jgi:hypothetical protein